MKEYEIMQIRMRKKNEKRDIHQTFITLSLDVTQMLLSTFHSNISFQQNALPTNSSSRVDPIPRIYQKKMMFFLEIGGYN